jgi:hypothetical protein
MSTSYNLSSTYEKIFSDFAWYNVHPLTEFRYSKAFEFLDTYSASSVLDVGSGRGNFLSLIKNKNNSITLNSCDLNNFHHLSYVNHFNLDIRLNHPNIHVDVVTCLDVLEHLPINDIQSALQNMKKTAKNFVFSVSNHSDVIGGVELHLTQLSKNDWLSFLQNDCNITNVFDYGVTYFFAGNFK